MSARSGLLSASTVRRFHGWCPLVNETGRQATARSEHVLQLFDTPDSLGEGVAAFLRDGLTHDDALLVVARGVHLQAITGALTFLHVPVRKLLESG